MLYPSKMNIIRYEFSHYLFCWTIWYLYGHKPYSSSVGHHTDLVPSHKRKCVSKKIDILKTIVFYFYFVRTQRRFNVFTTSITLERCRVNVETTLCAYWVLFGFLLIKLEFCFLSIYHSCIFKRNVWLLICFAWYI